MAGEIPKVSVAAKDRILLHLLANDAWADRYMVPATMKAAKNTAAMALASTVSMLPMRRAL